MSTAAPASLPLTEPAPSTDADRGTAHTPVRPRGRQWRWLALGAVLLVALVVLAVRAGAGPGGRALDPRSSEPQGSGALATLLEERDIEVRFVETTKDARAATTADSTLFIAAPQRLSPQQLRDVAASPADLVVVEPRRDLPFASQVEYVGPAANTDVAGPGTCPLAFAQRAGFIDGGGLLYTAPSDAGVSRCFEQEQGFDGSRAAGLVQLTTPERTITVLGLSEIFTNDRLDENGNAALALAVLGGNSDLVWYLPSPDDAPVGGQDSLSTLLPAGVRYAAFMLLLVGLIAALWRGRRLGPVLVEPLPVVVRAAETTEGRARLYRRARARDRAANILRDASRRRLAATVGLQLRQHPEALVTAVAGRSGRRAEDVAQLLAGPVPADDAQLVALADALDRLEKEVRRP